MFSNAYFLLSCLPFVACLKKKCSQLSLLYTEGTGGEGSELRTSWGGRRGRDLLRTSANVSWYLSALQHPRQQGHAKCSDLGSTVASPKGTEQFIKLTHH